MRSSRSPILRPAQAVAALPEDFYRNRLDCEPLARRAVGDIRKLAVFEFLHAPAITADDEPRPVAMRVPAAGNERIERFDAVHMAEGRQALERAIDLHRSPYSAAAHPFENVIGRQRLLAASERIQHRLVIGRRLLCHSPMLYTGMLCCNIISACLSPPGKECGLSQGRELDPHDLHSPLAWVEPHAWKGRDV